MNKTIQFFLILFAVSISSISFSQSKNKNLEKVTIQSSIQCGMCENKLSNMFTDFAGVKEVDYDLDNQTITVFYNPKKTNVEAIKEGISKTGYDADELPADISAYLELPACCQKKPTDANAHASEKDHASCEKGENGKHAGCKKDAEGCKKGAEGKHEGCKKDKEKCEKGKECCKNKS